MKKYDDFDVAVETVKEFYRREDRNWFWLDVLMFSLVVLVVVGFLAAALLGCAATTTRVITPKPGVTVADCVKLLEQRDEAALAGKILAGVGGVSALAAAPESFPEGARWGIAAGAAATASVGVAVIWYSEMKASEFELLCSVVEVPGSVSV